MTLDITQIKVKAKSVGVYCDGVLVERFYNEAEAIIWLANLSIRGLSFPHELKQCRKNEKSNKTYILKFIQK